MKAVLWINYIFDPSRKKPSWIRLTDLGFESKQFLLQFLYDILPLGSVDSHIFADSEPGSQNVADTNPKHWMNWEKLKKMYK